MKKITKFHFQIGNQLLNKLTSGFFFAFIFLQISQKKTALNVTFENFQQFLKCTTQIKISGVKRKNYFEPELQRQFICALQYS